MSEYVKTISLFDQSPKAVFDAAIDLVIEQAAQRAIRAIEDRIEHINRSRGQVFRHYHIRLENHR